MATAKVIKKLRNEKDVVEVKEITGEPLTFYSEVNIEGPVSLNLVGDASEGGIYFKDYENEGNIYLDGSGFYIETSTIPVFIGGTEIHLNSDLVRTNQSFIDFSKKSLYEMLDYLSQLLDTVNKLFSDSEHLGYYYNVITGNMSDIINMDQSSFDGVAVGQPILYSMGKVGSDPFAIISLVKVQKNADGTYQLVEEEQ